MRVFVTGGAGFIGGHIVRELLESADEVTVLTRSSAPTGQGENRIIGDLADVSLWAPALQGHQVLIHNALLWDDEPTELELRDPRASVSLYREAAAAGVNRVIYTSTQAVHRPFLEEMAEDLPLRPTDLYGATKAVNEILLFACADQFGFSACVVRPGPIVGGPVRGGRHASDRRIEEFIDLARAGTDIHVTQNEGRQFTSVRVLAQIFAKLVRTNLDREVFLCSDPAVITWEAVARLVVGATGSASRIVVSGPPAANGRFLVDKAERAFGLEMDAKSALKDHIGFLVSRQG